MKDVFDNTLILPKLWLEYIQRFWVDGMPTGYPDSASEFSITFEPEVKAAIKSMEDKIGTDECIVTPDMIPENKLLGYYLGTFEVTAEAGVETLLSPQKVPSYTDEVIAMHYNVENDNWEKIESAHVVDGYVYGTLDSFSPISVFVIKKDTFVTSSCEVMPGRKLYVANGIPVVVTTNEEGSVIATDANGKVTELDSTTIVVGGTIDGTDVEKTSVFVKNAVVAGIYGGSIGTPDTNPRIECATVAIVGVDAPKCGVTGAGFRNKVNSIHIKISDSKLSFVGNANSIAKVNNKQTDSNDNSKYNLACDEWAKNSNIVIDNSNITVLYCSSHNGYAYTQNAQATITNTEAGYFVCGGSNGRTDNVNLVAENCKFNISFETVNRGTVGSVVANLKNIVAPVFAVLGDPTDSSVNGSIESVKLNISGDQTDIVLYTGTQGGEVPTAEVAKEVVKYVKISRSSKVEYAEGTQSILRDAIVIK